MEQITVVQKRALRRQQAEVSYRAALSRSTKERGIGAHAWVTLLLVSITVAIWCFTAYQTAVVAGAHTFRDVITNVLQNAINVQDKDNDALTNVLIRYGAKENGAILHGQYWRFITPIFLHANLLHVGLNMLNLLVLGVFLERLTGHLRFALIYLITGIVSVIASFVFAPQEVSVGASGAIFGLVGAYSIFVLAHRRAFRYGGLPALLWLVFIIGINLSIGLFISNVDNYAHLGGLISGCLLGWWFTPLYKPTSMESLTDIHSLRRRWPLALLTILGTLILAVVAVYTVRA